MLTKIFGNLSAERTLFHIYHYGEIHASAIAGDYNISATGIIHQLDRFEEAGILISKEIGRSRVYSFNQKSAYFKPIQEILKIAYESIPLKERQKIFKERRRPRRKGKPVYAKT